MSEHGDGQSEDFSVLHGDSGTLVKALALYDLLKAQCKRVDVESKMLPQESLDQFLMRISVASTADQTALYRKADSANDALSLIWMSLIRKKALEACLAKKITCSQCLSVESLTEIASYNVDTTSIRFLPDLLAERYGVILVIEGYLPAMKLDGCAFKLPNGVPVIGLSLRYKRYDSFWFTVMHELAHICLHYDLLDVPIMDDFESGEDTDVELEANRLASDSLVPRAVLRRVLQESKNTRRLIQISKEAGCHPAIVAGMVRHRTNNWATHSDLVNFMDVKAELAL